MALIGAFSLLAAFLIDPVLTFYAVGILLMICIIGTVLLNRARERRARRMVTEVRLRYLLEKSKKKR